eukprot:m.685105 g.685105  ORF g.685105 m.685105 type:complete len:124 (-) comp22835_c0_seq9:4609-4980(-)
MALKLPDGGLLDGVRTPSYTAAVAKNGKSTLTIELRRQHLDETWGFGLGSKDGIKLVSMIVDDSVASASLRVGDEILLINDTDPGPRDTRSIATELKECLRLTLRVARPHVLEPMEMAAAAHE